MDGWKPATTAAATSRATLITELLVTDVWALVLAVLGAVGLAQSMIRMQAT